MKNTTARYFAFLYLEEMAEETGFTYEEINQQMPMAQAIVAGILFEQPEIKEEDLACEFVHRYMVAF